MKKYQILDKILLTLGCLFLVIPIIMLLFFWFKWYISLPGICLLSAATILALKKIKPLKEEEYQSIFQIRKGIILIVLIVLLNLISGAGGLFHQNWDYHFRNTVFHDLVERQWPVKYDYKDLEYEKEHLAEEGMLTYYFAFWLPSAAVGKMAHSFELGNICLLLYQTAGCLLFFYLIARKMKQLKLRYFAIFLAFGGLNIIGQFFMNHLYGLEVPLLGTSHIDVSMGQFCMSTFITQLFWVFNQSVPAWIATMFLFQEKDYRTCGYFFALLVPFAPFPMLGYLYIAFCFIIFGRELNKKINIDRIKELLTFENIASVLAIIPIAFMFTLNTSKRGIVFLDAYRNGSLSSSFISYLLYLILEFGVYAIILNKKNKKEIIMYFLFFAIVPLFYIGGADLGNRSTIPLLIGLFLLVLEELDCVKFGIGGGSFNRQLKQGLLIGILAVSFLTNFNEIYRSITYTNNNRKNNISNFADNFKTYGHFENSEVEPFIPNFVSPYDPNNFYFKYILQ